MMARTRIGFTGTREGMTAPQRDQVAQYLDRVVEEKGSVQFSHGGCCGADWDFHVLLRARGFSSLNIAVHPSALFDTYPEVIRERLQGRRDDVSIERAWWAEGGHASAPDSPLARNLAIVVQSQRLVACPAGPEVRRSGTWSTVRAARRYRRPVLIVMPDGGVRREPA